MSVDWKAYAAGVEAQLGQLRKDLAPLETGELRMSRRRGDGPWEDTTAEMIEHLKRSIETYETILADVKTRRI